MKKTLLLVLAFLFSTTLCLCTYITLLGLFDVTPKSDVIVVLGNAVNPDGTLSPRLRARMDRAIDLFRDGKGKYLFVSGALGKEGVEESAAMRAYAQSEGVPSEYIIADPYGKNTDATAKNAAKFLRESNLNSVILVSQFFHLARSESALQKQGITQIGHASARYHEWRDAYSLLREVVALPVYWITK